MHDLLACAGLLLAATITPGPNNLVVLREAGHGGVRAAIGAIGGIVLGGLALLVVVATGAGALLSTHATLRVALAAAGAAYMAWLGVRLLGHTRGPESLHATVLPAGVLGLFGFQFLNPKGWAMVTTIVAAHPTTHPAGYLPLVLLFTVIPLACLLLWGFAGQRLAVHLAHPRTRRRIDAVMAVLLFASAALLLIDL